MPFIDSFLKDISILITSLGTSSIVPLPNMHVL